LRHSIRGSMPAGSGQVRWVPSLVTTRLTAPVRLSLATKAR
jgi:hypothetical protein